MKKATVITSFGNLEFEYETSEDLDSCLIDIIADAILIGAKTIGITKREPRKVKPGMDEIYQFTPSGKVELLHYPQALVAQCILVVSQHDYDGLA